MSVLVLSGLFLASGALGFDQTYTVWSDASSQTQSKWFGDYDVTTGRSDGTFKVGGSGDHYISMLKIPVNLPVPGRYLFKGANLNMYSYGSTRPTTMQKIFWLGPWSQDSTSDHWGLIANNTYGGTGKVPAPPANGWYSMDVSSEVFWWLNGIYPNYGIGLYPDNNDNRFNNFYSPKGPGGGLTLRPFITIQYETIPDFKMPLDGNGKAWKLTTECGGKEYDDLTAMDHAHTGQQYYSLDFGHFYTLNGGTTAIDTTGTDMPILAVAGGVIIPGKYDSNNPNSPNGYYVKIDHDYDGNTNTGFQTIYLHMKYPPMVHIGDIVHQGQQLGVMGNTGDPGPGNQPYGVHLHITFYFQSDAGPNGSDSIELKNVIMDGFFLDQYKLGLNWNGSIWLPQEFYSSSNVTR